LSEVTQAFSHFAAITAVPDQTADGPIMAHFEPFRNPLVAHRGTLPQQGRQGQVVVLRDENDLMRMTLPPSPRAIT